MALYLTGHLVFKFSRVSWGILFHVVTGVLSRDAILKMGGLTCSSLSPKVFDGGPVRDVYWPHIFGPEEKNVFFQ